MTVFVEEYGTITLFNRGDNIQVPEGVIASHEVTPSSTTARTSTPFNSKTRFVLIFSDEECRFILGDSTVTADSSDLILPARTFRTMGVADSTHLAVILR